MGRLLGARHCPKCFTYKDSFDLCNHFQEAFISPHFINEETEAWGEKLNVQGDIARKWQSQVQTASV